MTRSICLFLLLLIFSVQVEAQENQYIATPVTVGENYKEHVPITGQALYFDQYIYDCRIDTVSEVLILQLRSTNKKQTRYTNEGKVVVYDLTSLQKLWEHPISYMNFSLGIAGKLLYCSHPSHTRIYALRSGILLREIDQHLLYTDTLTYTGIVYRRNSQGKIKNKLEGISLLSGEKSWEFPLDLQFGCDAVQPLNDSIVLFSTNGLHACNIYNGKGWHYPVTTTQKDFKANIATNALGIAAGFLTGTFFYTTGHDLLSGLHSAILPDSTGFYFASKEYIARLNVSGGILWQVPFSPEQAGSSLLFLRDTTLYVLNYGFGNFSNKKIVTGRPFLAAYHKHSGKPAFFTLLSENPVSVQDYILNEDHILLLSQGCISKYSLKDGRCLFQQNYEMIPDETWVSFLRSEYYTRQDSVFRSFQRDDSTYFYISNGHQIVKLSKTSDERQEIEVEKLYPCYLAEKDHQFLLGDDKTFIIDKNHKFLAELNFTKRISRQGSHFYYIDKNTLYRFDTAALP